MKKKLAIALSSLPVLAVSGLAFAAEGDAVSTADAMKTAFQTVATDTISTVAAVAPIAITIFGCMLVWKLGKKFFSRMSNG